MIKSKIEIIGENCSNRTKLIKSLNKATKDTLLDNIEINVIDDENSLKKYKSKSKPLLIINDVIVSSGKVLSDREIKNYIKVFA